MLLEKNSKVASEMQILNIPQLVNKSLQMGGLLIRIEISPWTLIFISLGTCCLNLDHHLCCETPEVETNYLLMDWSPFPSFFSDIQSEDNNAPLTGSSSSVFGWYKCL